MTTTYFRSVERDDPMVTVDAKDIISDVNTDLKNVDNLDGNGRGALIEVKGGSFWLCKGTLIMDADVGVIVDPYAELRSHLSRGNSPSIFILTKNEFHWSRYRY